MEFEIDLAGLADDVDSSGRIKGRGAGNKAASTASPSTDKGGGAQNMTEDEVADGGGGGLQVVLSFTSSYDGWGQAAVTCLPSGPPTTAGGRPP